MNDHYSAEEEPSWFQKLAAADPVAWMYAAGAAILYIALATLIGKKDQLFAVFFANAWSDLTGDTPRMLAQIILSQAIGEDMSSLGSGFGDAILMTIPLALPFSVINDYIMKFVKKENAGTAVVTFIAGYLLQAIIALAWTSPVSIETVSASLSSLLADLIVGVLAIGGIVFVLRATIRNTEIDFGQMTSVVVNIPMALVFAAVKELIKAFAITMVYSILVVTVIALAQAVKFVFLIKFFSAIAPFIYLILFNLFNKLGDVTAAILISILSKDPDIQYKQTKYGELFCFVAAVAMIVVCYCKHF